MYERGQGVDQSDIEAVKWYTKAAEQGYASAQFNIGVMYERGQGVDQGDIEAVTWYTKAAEQGYANAQFNLGVMYERGQGVDQSDIEAAKWYTKAAEQGHAKAQCNLGVMYDKGRGVDQDNIEAVKWYTMAAEQGLARAQFNLGVMYDEGQGFDQSDIEAVKWYTMAAEQGYASAQFNIGVMYERGQGVDQGDIEAVTWYTKAAEQGYANAQFNLGVMYERGQGVDQSDIEAVKWYTMAAEQGDAGAQFNLGLISTSAQEAKTRMRHDKRVSIFGIGGLGHMALQWARAFQAKEVVAISTSDDKRDEPKQLGATRFVNSRDKDSMKQASGSMELLLVTSLGPDTDYNELLGLVANNGTCVLLAVPEKDISLSVSSLRGRHINLTAWLLGGRRAIRQMLDFAAKHHVRPWIETMPMSDANAAIKKAMDGFPRYRVVMHTGVVDEP
ncbi:hypothetical protein DFQ26_001159 [Actinomortierella ambigua]|nr:hypothetical protein DFQ26_001159 [Actinomortierella ambigua]